MLYIYKYLQVIKLDYPEYIRWAWKMLFIMSTILARTQDVVKGGLAK